MIVNPTRASMAAHVSMVTTGISASVHQAGTAITVIRTSTSAFSSSERHWAAKMAQLVGTPQALMRVIVRLIGMVSTAQNSTTIAQLHRMRPCVATGSVTICRERLQVRQSTHAFVIRAGRVKDRTRHATLISMSVAARDHTAQVKLGNSNYWFNHDFIALLIVDPPVECINYPGGFRCGPCPLGYRKLGNICVDIDECKSCLFPAGCSVNPGILKKPEVTYQKSRFLLMWLLSMNEIMDASNHFSNFTAKDCIFAEAKFHEARMSRHKIARWK